MSITTRRTDLSGRTFILDGNINFRVTGTRSPSLIFVHGFGCALEDWDAQVEALWPKFRCAALDLPGHGSSARPANISIASMAGAVNQVKEALGPGPKLLVGHSMGCRVVLEAYVQSRDDVVGLIFVDGSIIGGDPETGVNRAKERACAGIDLLTQDLFDEMFVEGSDPAVCERLVARAKKVEPLVREGLFIDMVRWDLTKGRDALRQITVPVLVLQSTYFNSEFKRVRLQPGMTTPWMEAITASVPRSQVKVVPNAGHFCLIDAARRVSEEIGNFAAAVAKGQRQ